MARWHVCETPRFKVGDPPPKERTAYLAWHEWARVQRQGGLRQVPCGECSLWKFPQELSGRVIKSSAIDGATLKRVTLRSAVCLECVRAARGEEG